MFNYKKLLYIILVLTLIFTVSCKSKQKSEVKTEKEQIPQNLKNIQDTVEEIIAEVEKLKADLESPSRAIEKQQKSKEEESKEDSQSEDGKKEEGNKEEDKQKGEEKEKEKKEEDKQKQMEEFQKQVDKIWVEIGKKITDIHSGWNDFQPKAIEDGASQEDLKRFEDSLNILTKKVQVHDILETLNMANEVTIHTARFLDFYKGNIDNNILRLKYFVRKSYLDSLKGDWEKVKEDVKGAFPIFEKIKTKIKLSEKDKKLLEKLELSIKDLETVINEKNPPLIKIKRDIVLNNLAELKSAEK